MLLGGCGGGGNSSDGGGAVVRIGSPTSFGATPTPPATPSAPPEVDLSAERIYQAGTALVSLVSPAQDAVSGVANFIGRSYPLTQGQRSIYAFVAAGPDDAAGVQKLSVDFVLKSGSKGTVTSTIEVLKTNWTQDAVIVPASLLPLTTERASNAEVAQLGEFYGKTSGEKLWQQGWHVPVEGPITTRFGEERSYNGGPITGHHLGTDLGANDGTPIAVTNGGRVVMARQLQLRGNMVIVDHGGGVFSGYAHMKSFAVAEGQAVNQGDLLGYVGSTGLSTGAHLHWEIAVGGVLVDAYRFVDGSNGF